MMGNDNTGLIIGGVIVAIIAYYFLFKSSTNLATEAGKWVAKNIINPAINPAANPLDVYQTGLAGEREGGTITNIPKTPIGNSPSNWTWSYADMPGVSIGLPAGMTRNEFCRAAGSTADPALCGYYADLPWYQKLW